MVAKITLTHCVFVAPSTLFIVTTDSPLIVLLLPEGQSERDEQGRPGVRTRTSSRSLPRPAGWLTGPSCITGSRLRSQRSRSFTRLDSTTFLPNDIKEVVLRYHNTVYHAEKSVTSRCLRDGNRYILNYATNFVMIKRFISFLLATKKSAVIVCRWV